MRENISIKGWLLVAILFLLSACSTKPLIEQKVVEVKSKDSVVIKAKEGYDSYSWKQLSGIKVDIKDSNSPILKFRAPNVSKKEELVFELKVTINSIVNQDIVKVIVNPIDNGNSDNNSSGNNSSNNSGGNNNSDNNNSGNSGGDSNNSNKDNNSSDNNSSNNNGGNSDNNSSGGGGAIDNNKTDNNQSTITIPDNMLKTFNEVVVPYNTITLVTKAKDAKKLKAINKTLKEKYKKELYIKGYKNSNNNYYLYNIPLIKGDNTIELQATNSSGKVTSKTITISAEPKGYVPIILKSNKFSGVKKLDTTVEVATALKAKSYLFDIERDGIIDITQTDNKFKLNLNKEGRYKPRVTIKTEDGLYYSSGDYALSLDVKANKEQKDPAGAKPIDVAKEFVKAVLEDDRVKIAQLTGNNRQIEALLYANNKKGLKILQNKIYPNIIEWKEKDLKMDGRASIMYIFDINGTKYGGGMELKLISPQLYTGRDWIVTFIY